jgi:alkanesulfonate monooxygenase SsuD/methylene tetrahydromethanopterin reductase-like flavin-dependent oxidoreductase (luciferase family)
MAGDPIRVGIVLREQDLSAWSGRLRELGERTVAAGIDHLTVGDHVSFADGHGADGLIQAAALLSAHPAVSVQTGVYLLGLRHPAVVARQLATIALLAPGRFTFGVGVGGDDPRELEFCGINPRERGVQTTEALQCVRQLMTGEEVDFEGRFFNLHGAIRPAPAPAIPILVGGRSDAARARAGRLGDGWLALWV